MIFFFSYISKGGYILGIHRPATTCRCVLLSQQSGLFSRKLEQTFKNVKISHKNLDSRVFLKIERNQHAGSAFLCSQHVNQGAFLPVGQLSHSVEPLLFSNVFLTQAECQLPLIFAIAIISLIIQKYLAETMSLANDRKQKIEMAKCFKLNVLK